MKGKFIAQLLNCSIALLLFISILLLITHYPLPITSSVWAQEYEDFGLASRFGPHLACSNTEGFIRKIRGRYGAGQFNWSNEEWIPATIMFKVTDPPDYIKTSLTAMIDNSGGPKFWPIIRLDGNPHGSRISAEEIGEFIRSLGSLGSLRLPAAPAEGGEIFIAFANEPNHKEEWGGEINPQDYRERLGDFIREIRNRGQIGGIGEIRVLNGALDQRAGDSAQTMDAVNFWKEGLLSEVASELDGYAFNNYHFESSRRHSKEGWKIMRELFGIDESKPVFLLEFGKDPGSPIGLRQEFIRDEYLLEISQGNPAVEGVAAVTPLVCVDSKCKRINTAIFGKRGNVGWEEGESGGSCALEKVEGCGGKAGDRDDKGAADDNECADKVMRPYSLSGDRGISGLGSRIVDLLCRFPGIGNLCRWGKHGSRLKGDILPQTVINKPPSNFEPPAVGASVGEKTGVRLQAEIPGAGLARKIVGYFVSEPDTGYLQTYLPNSVLGKDSVDIQDAHNLVAGCGGNLGEGGMLIPYSLCKLKEGKPAEEIDIGQCKEGPAPYCDIENLLGYFDDDIEKAANASQICNIESDGNPEAVNEGCINGSSVDYSVGLFQINLLAHCPGAFRKYTWDPPSCTIADRDILDACVTRLKKVKENIKEAYRISSGGTDWSPWAAAGVCGIE